MSLSLEGVLHAARELARDIPEDRRLDAPGAVAEDDRDGAIDIELHAPERQLKPRAEAPPGRQVEGVLPEDIDERQGPETRDLEQGEQLAIEVPARLVVGRGRFERPTNGLKIHCSTG